MEASWHPRVSICHQDKVNRLASINVDAKTNVFLALFN